MQPSPSIRGTFVALLALAVVAMGAPAAAHAQVSPLEPPSQVPESLDKPPPGFRVTAREAVRTADRLPAVHEARRENPGLRPHVDIPLYLGDARRYSISYVDSDWETQADIHVSGLTGEVVEQWTGPQARMLLGRGYKPSVGRALDSPYIWLPLALLFVAPFVDPRRPFRLLHLDLIVLLGFGVSQYFFNKGDVHTSVPLVYPLLAYLLIRTALAGFRPRERRTPLMPFARTSWLVVGLVLLMVFRVGLNVVDSTVIDVGYASVVGADRIQHKEELYVANDIHGDTYGPVTYLAYVPFELLFPTDGTWDEVPAAHAAALIFDLLTVIGLMLVGTRLRQGAEGRTLGVALAFAWAAYPFTLLGLQTNTNDGLVALLVVFALLALSSPAKRGLMLGLATAAKFAPVVLAPLLATATGEERRLRSWASFVAAFGGIVALSVILYLPDGGLREVYDATIGYQLGRDSALSIWQLHPSLGWLQDVVKLAALAFAAALAFVPRRRDLRQVAGLGAAAIVASQLGVSHWFYLYIPWFTPLVLVAAFGAYGARERARPAESSPTLQVEATTGR
ncbi:MAG TPA: glycosyltransferase family 87 protein [Thermoleophilaceae bacterium]|nr:glycosyltransferase family 87 protein [Thermoleophilaceae bacterium]